MDISEHIFISVPDCSAVEFACWAEVLHLWGTQPGDSRPKQLKHLVRRGIPEALRGEVWLRLADCSADTSVMDAYRVLITKECSADPVIMRDIHRTFPAHDFFKDSGGLGQEALAKISRAYAVYDEEVGYCQVIQILISYCIPPSLALLLTGFKFLGCLLTAAHARRAGLQRSCSCYVSLRTSRPLQGSRILIFVTFRSCVFTLLL